MNADILADIDKVLADWEKGYDAARWRPWHALPELTPEQERVARELCAMTGVDGYAAAFMVADVAEYGQGSPHAGEVRAVLECRRADAFLALQRQVTRQMQAITVAVNPMVRAFTEMAGRIGAIITASGTGKREVHAIAVALCSRGHGHCRTCHPEQAPRQLAVDGHAYQRRLKNRRKKGRR